MDKQFTVEIQLCSSPFYCKRLDKIGFFSLKLHNASSFNDFYETLCQKIEKKGLNSKKMRIVNLQKSGKIKFLIWLEEESRDVERFNIEYIVKNWPKKYRWDFNQPFGQFVDHWMEFEKKVEIFPLLENNSYGDDKNQEDIFNDLELDDLKK